MVKEPSLREKLWGKTAPLRERLADIVAPPSKVSYTQEEPKPVAGSDMPALKPTATPIPAPAVKTDDGALVPQMKPVVPTSAGINIKRMRDAIAFNESRGEGTDQERYAFSRDSGRPDLGKAIGRYQVTEGEINDYAELILGRKITPQEFQQNPKLQDEYVDKKLEMILRDAPDATEDEILALHRGGLPGRADPEVRKDKVKQYKEYVDSGKQFLTMNQVTEAPIESDGDTVPPLDDIKDENWQDPTPDDMNREKLNLLMKEKDEVIKEYNPKLKDRLGPIFDKFKSKVPFLDTNMEKALRNDIAKAYPFTPEAQKILKGININVVDGKKFKADEVQGTYNPVRGERTWNLLNKVGDKLPQMPNKLFSTLVGETMNVENIAANVVAHESLHAMFQRATFDERQFLKDWEDAKLQSSDAETLGNVHRLMPYIEDHIAGSDVYENIPPEQLANEMFAYLGEIAGMNGMKGIPGNLRKYYEGIFTEK